MTPTLKLATRSSKLALTQSRMVQALLKARWPNLVVEEVQIKTSGDLMISAPLRDVGGKGLFVKEIEEALLSGQADFAVHSLKDVPALLPSGLTLSTILEREDPADWLVLPDHFSKKTDDLLSELPQNARIGTTSLRRKVQLLKLRPDLAVHDLRGNVDTRMRKLNDGEYDAIILAAAGLKRLGMIPKNYSPLPFIPAPAQGAIGLECRAGDLKTQELLAPLHHENTAICVFAERVILEALEGNCQVAMGAWARMEGENLKICAFDQKDQWREAECSGELRDANLLAKQLLKQLNSKAGGC